MYWDWEWEDDDMYIKYYERMPLGLFYMENIFSFDGKTDAATDFIVCLVLSPCSKPKMLYGVTCLKWPKRIAVFLKEDPWNNNTSVTVLFSVLTLK